MKTILMIFLYLSRWQLIAVSWGADEAIFSKIQENTCVLKVLQKSPDAKVFLVRDEKTGKSLVKKVISFPAAPESLTETDKAVGASSSSGASQAQPSHSAKKEKLMISEEQMKMNQKRREYVLSERDSMLHAQGNENDLIVKVEATKIIPNNIDHACKEFVGDKKDLDSEGENLVIFMEHLPGKDLFDVISLNDPNDKDYFLNEKDIASVFEQIVKAVAYLHRKNIVHRDLKSENVIFYRDELKRPRIKLIDFGYARIVSEANPIPPEFCGTANFIAPELAIYRYKAETIKKMVEKLGQPTMAVDTWSLGVMIFMLQTKMFPIGSHTEDQAFANTFELKPERIPIILKYLPEFRNMDFSSENFKNSWGDLFIKIMQMDPKKRPSLDQILQHPWLQKTLAL
jgi:serine/threonine protein kinase